MADLSNKHALVTGGGSGVGAEIASAFAEAGASVTITGRRKDSIEAVADRYENINAITGDVTDAASIKNVFESGREQFGAINIVVANAGTAKSVPFGKTGDDLWQHMLNVNLTGVYQTFKQGLDDMQKSGWGRLIAISSTAGLKGYAYVSAYCAAKHGVVGLCRALAAETAGIGITVNAVCPGFTDTPLLDASIKTIVAKTGKTSDEARSLLAANNPMGRLITPKEVADTVLWLAGSGADAITGQAISVSGGETG